MSRFFHTLVIVGAGISAACGGQSESHSGGEGADGGGGSSGTGTGGAAASGGSAAKGGTDGGGTAGSGGDGGSIPTAGGTGGSGGSARGGTSGTGGASAGTGGFVLGGGTGGTGMQGPFPDSELPTSQWDCSNSYMGCADVLGVTAHQLTGDCPVDESLPKSAADCAPGELYTCMLAVTATGEPLLVNCDCTYAGADNCGGCRSLRNRDGAPVSCTPTLKICECAYTGILR